MEQLANLPTPALITFGATLAIIFGVRYLGLWQGAKVAPAASQAAAQVAAVIVDPTALNAACLCLTFLPDTAERRSVRDGTESPTDVVAAIVPADLRFSPAPLTPTIGLSLHAAG